VAAGLAEDANIEAAVAQAMVVQQPGARGAFLPQLSTVFAAIGGQAGDVAVRDLRYLGSAGSIVMTAEAQDIATLQAVETALHDAGLAVASGAATSGNGLAEQQLTITGGAP
jgi:general secretion pathway protein L